MPKQHRKGTRHQDTAVRGPERTCLVHRVVKHPDEMIRFALDYEGHVVPDLKGTLPGRGVWVTAFTEDIDFAVKKALFSRGFKQKVKADEALAERIGMLLEAVAQQSLGLAAKAGLVTCGFEKVLAATAKKDLRAILFASDGSDGGIGKMRAKLRAGDRLKDVNVHQSLRSDQMALALGRANVIHAALRKGGASEMCLKNMDRLDRYRAPGPSEDCDETMV